MINSGWQAIKDANPKRISDLVHYASLGSTQGTILNSTDYNAPTGGSWIANPITVTSSPIVSATNIQMVGDQIIKAQMFNNQTDMLNSSAPAPLDTTIFVYGNAQNLDYQMQIPLDFGGSSYDLCQLSYFVNSVTSGNSHGFTQVFDFNGTFTGVQNLDLIFSDLYGIHQIGIRVESTTNQSSIMFLQVAVLPSDDKNIFSGVGSGSSNVSRPDCVFTCFITLFPNEPQDPSPVRVPREPNPCNTADNASCIGGPIGTNHNCPG